MMATDVVILSGAPSATRTAGIACPKWPKAGVMCNYSGSDIVLLIGDSTVCIDCTGRTEESYGAGFYSNVTSQSFLFVRR